MKKLLLSTCFLISSLLVPAQSTINNATAEKAPMSWTSIRLSYAPSTIKDINSSYSSNPLNCFSIEGVKGFSLMKDKPLALEVGVGIDWFRDKTIFGGWGREDLFKYNYKGQKIDDIFSIIVPVNLGYRMQLNEDISLMPYVGLKARWGFSATRKTTYNYEILYDDKDADRQEGGNSTNLYSSDSTNELNGNSLKRFLPGWQIGVTATYKFISLGVNYSSCFTNELYKNVPGYKLSSKAITVGINL